jgi:hypothetical protein
MNMAESVDSFEDTFRVHGVHGVHMSKTFKINQRTRELNEMKTYTGEVIQTSPQEKRRSDVN